MSQPKVAVIGGGIAGTLCSLVLKNRGLHPILIDSGKSGVGGRLRSNMGAQFIRSVNPQLSQVLFMLQQQGLIEEWKGRFGMLGSSQGGFLPAEIVTMNKQGSGSGSGGGNIMGLQQAGFNEDGPTSTHGTGTDIGDFCQFVEGSNIATFVGIPSMTQLCPEICRIAGIEEVNNTKFVGATPNKEGGWSLNVDNDTIDAEDTIFDALVLATHDPSIASGAIRSIVDAEIHAGEFDTVQDALNVKDDASIVLSRLLEISNSLQRVRDNDKMPVYGVSLTYPIGFSQHLPFDAVSIPGSTLVQFLVRDGSKPGNNGKQTTDGNERWTAITTSQFASSVLNQQDLSSAKQQHAISLAVTNEVSKLIQPYYNGQTVPTPTDVNAKRWGAAFCSRGLQLKEDSIFLAPWRLSICGDYIRDLSAHSNPLEAAAISGLEAGERIASLWIQQS